MRKLVLKMSVSADGYMCGPNGEIDWLFRTMNQSAANWVGDTLWQAGLHIMGSRTFNDMAAYWPTSTDMLAAPMNAIPKAVFSKKGIISQNDGAQTTQALKDAKKTDGEKGIVNKAVSEHASTWEHVPVYNNIVDDINQLKQQDGRFILAHGGAGFVRALVQHGLIDEYRLVIHPVFIGKGIAMFAEASAYVYVKLASTTVLEGGVIANIYTPVK